jgi:hypothetical protein
MSTTNCNSYLSYVSDDSESKLDEDFTLSTDHEDEMSLFSFSYDEIYFTEIPKSRPPSPILNTFDEKTNNTESKLDEDFTLSMDQEDEISFLDDEISLTTIPKSLPPSPIPNTFDANKDVDSEGFHAEIVADGNFLSIIEAIRLTSHSPYYGQVSNSDLAIAITEYLQQHHPPEGYCEIRPRIHKVTIASWAKKSEPKIVRKGKNRPNFLERNLRYRKSDKQKIKEEINRIMKAEKAKCKKQQVGKARTSKHVSLNNNKRQFLCKDTFHNGTVNNIRKTHKHTCFFCFLSIMMDSRAYAISIRIRNLV